jgi:uncharacterized LabA/DUF88 family protein
MDNKSTRIAVFIDASNIWQAQKSKGRMFDFAKLKSYLQITYNAQFITCYYYTAYPAEGTRTYNTEAKHKFFTYLKRGLGYVVRKKELKRILIHGDNGSTIQEKGNMDVEMTIDAVHTKDSYDAAIFFTGDSDFLALVAYLQNNNKKVYIYSSKNNVSSELRTGANGYTDILKLNADIWGPTLAPRR